MPEPGSAWVDGTELHFLDSTGAEYFYEGTVVESGTSGAPGSAYVDESSGNVYYVDANQDLRELPQQASRSVAATQGSVYVDENAKIRFIDPSGGSEITAGIEQHDNSEHSSSGHDDHSSSGHDSHSSSGHDSHSDSGHDNHNDNSGHNNHTSQDDGFHSDFADHDQYGHEDHGHDDHYSFGHDDHSDNSAHDSHYDNSGHNNHYDNSGHNNHSDNSVTPHDDHTDSPQQVT